MKARSAKNKGMRFESYLVDRFKKEVGATCHITKGSGAGLDKGDLNVPKHNLVIEAKNASQYAIGPWIKQAESQVFNGEKWALVFRDKTQAEFKRSFALIDLEYFIELLNNQGNGEIKVNPELTYSQSRALQGLKSSISKVMNEFK